MRVLVTGGTGRLVGAVAARMAAVDSDELARYVVDAVGHGRTESARTSPVPRRSPSSN